MKSIAPKAARRKVIGGVDTHKDDHVAVAIDHLGARHAELAIVANTTGYIELVAWARSLGDVIAFGIEGTGSYGAGVASFVRRQAIKVVEVNHCDRRGRRRNGKTDTLDAEAAAAVFSAGRQQRYPSQLMARPRWCA